MFTFCDSSRDDDDHGISRSTGVFLIVYQDGVVDHSSNIPEPVVMISAEAEYTESCMACMAPNHIYMNMNHIEEVED
jgi:hypothetical protein